MVSSAPLKCTGCDAEIQSGRSYTAAGLDFCSADCADTYLIEWTNP